MFGTSIRRIGLFFLVIVFFEIFFGRILEIFGFRPDLFLIVIVFWAFVINRHTAPQIAIVLGLIRDFFATGFFGAETLSYFLCAVFISVVSLKLNRQNYWMRGFTCFIFSLLHFWLYALIIFIMDEAKPISRDFWWVSIYHSFYTAVIATWIMRFFERWLYPRQSHISFNT